MGIPFGGIHPEMGRITKGMDGNSILNPPITGQVMNRTTFHQAARVSSGTGGKGLTQIHSELIYVEYVSKLT